MSGAIRVLHVDDDPQMGDLTARFLERERAAFEIETATDAREALDRIHDVDCIVSDYQMPGLDGLEFLERVRAERPGLPFILFTGKGSEEIASEAMSAGVTDYFQKEASSDQYAVLANRIESAVSYYQAERELERSEERYRALVESSPVAIALFDEAGVIQYANGATADLIGADDPEEVVGTEAIEFVHPEARNRHRERIELLIDEREPTPAIETRIVGLDDEVRHVTIVGTPVSYRGEPAAQVVLNDVTEQKERQRELERYETILAAAGDPMYALDEDGHVTFVNDRFEELTGYAAAEIRGEHASTFLPDVDVERGTELIRSLLHHDRDRATIEMDLQTADGESVACEIHVALLPFEEEFRGTSGVIRDVTARKQRERELERYGAIVESMSEGAYVLDEEYRVRFVSPRRGASPEVAGTDWTDEPIAALSDADLLTDEQAARIREDVDRLLAGERSLVEREFEPPLPADVAAISLRMTPVSLLGEERVLVTIRDVTRRKRRQRRLESLQAASRRLLSAETETEAAQVAVETATDVLDLPLAAVWTHDADADLLRPVAYPDHDALPDDPPTIGPGEGLSWEAFEAGETRVYDDIDPGEAYNPDTPIESEIVVPLGEFGVLNVGAMESASFDDADRYLADILGATTETALERARRRAERRERRRELERQNERLEEFASIVSHDLRNPLNVAIGKIDAAPIEDESIDDARAALLRMSELIDELLELARTGRAVEAPEAVSLSEVVRQAWATTGGEGTLEVADDLGRVLGDPGRVQQLFENLLANAIEHGSGDVQASLDVAAGGADAGVTVAVGPLEDGFFVEDDGPGVPEDERDAVFEPGYTTVEDGSGLGLAIVRDVAGAHGWTVDLREGERGGARFEFRGVDRP